MNTKSFRLLALGLAALLAGCASPTDSGDTKKDPAPVVKTLSSIKASPASVTLDIGATRDITVTGTYSDASTAAVTDAAWTISAGGGSVVSVTGNTVTALAEGSATLTATKEGKTATVAVTVNPAPVVEVPKYLFSSAGTKDITSGPDNWGSNAVLDFASTVDSTYTPVLSLTTGAGGWGTAVGFNGIPAGKIGQFTSVVFKVKATGFTSVWVKFPQAGTAEKEFAFTLGAPLAGGWTQMTIPFTEFGAMGAGENQVGIFGKGASGTILLTDIGFAGSAPVSAAALTAAVTAAKALQAAHPVGTANGNTPKAVFDAYSAAIAAAEAAPVTTWAEVTAATEALATATAAFNAGILVIGPGALPAAVSTPAADTAVLFSSRSAYAALAPAGLDLMQYWWNDANTPALTRTDFAVGGSSVLYYANFVSGGSCAIATATDTNLALGSKTRFHADLWVPAGQKFSFKIVTASKKEMTIEKDVSATLSQWVSVDADLSANADFATGLASGIIQVGLINSGSTSEVYLDNVLFY